MDFQVARLLSALDPLDAALAGRLESFVELTRGLTQSPLFKNPSLGLDFKPEAGGGFTPTLEKALNDLELRGTLTWFRQLWQDGEPTQFSSLRSALRQHVNASGRPDSADLVTWLDELGKEYSKVRRQLPDFGVLEAEIGPDGEVVRDGPVRAERIIDDWINGRVFHSDKEKGDRINAAGAAVMYEFSLLAALQEVTKIYVIFARMAKAIRAEPALQPA